MMMVFEYNGYVYERVNADAPELERDPIKKRLSEEEIFEKELLGMEKELLGDLLKDSDDLEDVSLELSELEPLRLPPPKPLKLLRSHQSRDQDVISYDEETGTFIVIDTVHVNGHIPYDWIPVLVQNKIIWFRIKHR